MSLEDPGVVRALLYVCHVGCPADAADRRCELEFAVSGVVSFGCAGTGAIDRHDRRGIRTNKVSHLLARQVALERQDPAIIDDRDVEPLPLSSHVNADPRCHESEHAPPWYLLR